ncbi:nucleoside diphosphate-linked moiety X motif 6 [Culicoides brevitarsis]|uniref:nucleoside diphosphate-linked moiety X motif 6 n=1 Tax=Culicoides brevitarsis TaxID=469753 RepID=UPI00307B744A
MHRYLRKSFSSVIVNNRDLFNFWYKVHRKSIFRAMSTSDTKDTILQASESWFAKYKNAPEVPDGIFRGVIDRFNGVTVDSNMEECDDSQFEGKLKDSLAFWKEANRRGVWFKVHLSKASWVPVLAKHNFDFHHAKEGFVMMCTWLANEPMGIPPFAHTMVGVGAVVVNDKQQVLVVSEKNALVTNSWKLPGGYLERKENIVDAGIREVQEETNIQTTFETLLAIRHAHGAGFGCSDLYVVMALNPQTTEITKCEREIAKCVWMDIEEFLQHPNVHETNRSFMRLYLNYKKNGVKIVCREDVHQILKKKYNIFEVETTEKE